MRKFLSVIILMSFLTALSVAQITPEAIRAYQKMDVWVFADTTEVALRMVGYPCDVHVQNKDDREERWSFICDFHRSYRMRLDDKTSEIWRLLGAVVGAFSLTKYTSWKSDKVWIAVKLNKVAYLRTADCRRLSVYYETGENFRLAVELRECLVIAERRF